MQINRAASFKPVLITIDTELELALIKAAVSLTTELDIATSSINSFCDEQTSKILNYNRPEERTYDCLRGIKEIVSNIKYGA